MKSTLEQAFKPLKRRVQWQVSLTLLWRTAITGLLLTGLLLGLGRLWPLLFQWQLLGIGFITTAILIFLGQIYVWFKPYSPQTLAKLGDQYLNLDERLITAIALESNQVETSTILRQAQLNDALTHLRQAPISLRVPLFEPKQGGKALGLFLALLLGVELLYLWPNPLEAVIQQQVELQTLIETEVAKLEEIQADLLTETTDLSETEIETLQDTFHELIEKLEAAQQANSPEQALAALAETDETLAALNEARSAQEQTFNRLADALAETDLEAAQEAANALRDGALDQAAEALQQVGQNAPSSQARRAEMAEALEEAASNLANTNPDLAQSLQQATEALRSGNQEAIQEAFNQAAQQMADAQNSQAGQQQLNQALENIQQAREQLAQQGEEPGQGQNQAQGQGAGSNQPFGQGRGGSGRGDPDGDVAAGTEADEGQPGPMSTDNGPNQNRLDDYASVYVPQHLGGEGGPFLVPNQQGSDGSGLDIGQTPLNPNRQTGEATVPYQDVFGQYRDQASTALDNDHIPLGMRDYIRQYFGALEPGQ